MPTLHFAIVQFGKTKTLEEELPSAELASLRAIEMAHSALLAGDLTDADHSGSIIKVYDEAGYLVARDKAAPSRPPSRQHRAGPQRSGLPAFTPELPDGGRAIADICRIRNPHSHRLWHVERCSIRWQGGGGRKRS